MMWKSCGKVEKLPLSKGKSPFPFLARFFAPFSKKVRNSISYATMDKGCPYLLSFIPFGSVFSTVEAL